MLNKEVEFKFVIADVDIPILRQLPLIQSLLIEPPKIKHFHTIYWDTRDGKLKQQSYMLRVRQIDAVLLQTLKKMVINHADTEGLHRNNEWECELTHPQIDVAQLPTTFQQKVRAYISDIKPIFSSDFNREMYLLHLNNRSVIELAIDQGKIMTKRRSIPLCEIELELKTGTVTDLKQLAQQLQSQLTLIPEKRTKAERGYTLVNL